jgi:hypothetical protein
MGDAPLAFVETTGGVRVSEDDVVVVGKNDASTSSSFVCYQTNVHRFCRSKLAEQVERRSLPVLAIAMPMSRLLCIRASLDLMIPRIIEYCAQDMHMIATLLISYLANCSVFEEFHVGGES